MRPSRLMDPAHAGTRKLLRIAGPILLAIGLACFLGAIPLVVATGRFGFGFLGFVGVFLLFIGSTMTMFGFMGALARYQAREVAPVASDTFNYLAGETRPGVRAMAGAFRDGLSGHPRIGCSVCGNENDVDASFCSSCGAALETRHECLACGTLNESDANYCDSCGAPLSHGGPT